MNLASIFFSSGPFMPHGGCYLWTTSLIALHVVSDAFIVLAYYSIPVTLFYFVRKRKDLKFQWMFVCFGLFILSCGTTHLMEIWNIWYADYWLSGGIKAITALTSVPTAFMLVKLIPTMLALPSPSALEKARDELELRVAERTRQLQIANEKLTQAAAERIRAEEAQVQLAAIVNSTDDAIIGKTLDGIITSWNPGAARIFGYSAAEAIGQPMAMLIPPERAAEEPDILARIARGEQVDHFETIRIRKDGQRINVSVTISAIRDRTGRVIGASNIARDITAHRQAEASLRTSLQEITDLKTALDEHAIVAITDPHGKITYVNDKFCAISKYAREELIGRDHRIINSGHHAKEFIRDLWTTIMHGRVWHGEIKNQAKDGTFYWVDTTIVPFLNDEGKPRQYVAIRADITGRKAAEEEVIQLNAELEQRIIKRTAELKSVNNELEAFSYSVSHDLRAPLRAVNGFAGIVLEDFSHFLPEDGRRYLERIRNGGQRMGQLIDDLLEFARLSRNQMSCKSVDMEKIIQNVLDEMKPQMNDRVIELKVGQLPKACGDPVLLRQLWLNLLSNAVKYTRGREPAVVEIGGMSENGGTKYFIRDNGAGFNMKYADKLFGVFQRLHRQEEFEGTGVGLAIVQRIVHRHDGRVWAEAKENGGATFHFILPDKNQL